MKPTLQEFQTRQVLFYNSSRNKFKHLLMPYNNSTCQPNKTKLKKKNKHPYRPIYTCYVDNIFILAENMDEISKNLRTNKLTKINYSLILHRN